MIKAYLKKICGHMKENGKEDRIKPFQAGATEFVKFVVTSFEKFTVYLGDTTEVDGAMTVCYRDEFDEDHETFLFLIDGLKEEGI